MWWLAQGNNRSECIVSHFQLAGILLDTGSNMAMSWLAWGSNIATSWLDQGRNNTKHIIPHFQFTGIIIILDTVANMAMRWLTQGVAMWWLAQGSNMMASGLWNTWQKCSLEDITFWNISWDLCTKSALARGSNMAVGWLAQRIKHFGLYGNHA